MPILGNPITAADVSTDPQYQGEIITPYIMSEAAMRQKNRLLDGVDLEKRATDAVQSMGQANGDMLATLIVIYNATGGDLKLLSTQDWFGHRAQDGLDLLIQNGQWSTMLHTHVAGTWGGSVGCCVYQGDEADFFMGWSNPYGGSSAGNGVYVESRGHGHWPGVANWDSMYDPVNQAGAISTDNTPPYRIDGSIGSGATPICEYLLLRTA